MSVILELLSSNGSVSFTTAGAEYLDVESGRGMEPGDPQFTNKVFARSLLKPGATLALEELREKELVFPLKLHAANKTALAALVQKINTVMNTNGCEVKWQDDGASQPTYFDVLSGKLDDEYDFRLGQNNWLKCRMRIFTQPLGYQEQVGAAGYRTGVAQKVAGVATTVAVGSTPVITFQGATAVSGDISALITASLEGLAEGLAGPYAMSVLPVGSYAPLWPAASGLGGGWANVATTGDGIGSGFWRSTATTAVAVNWSFPTGAYQYLGPQRVIGLLRSANTTMVELQENLGGGSSKSRLIGRATIAAGGAPGNFNAYDFGVVNFSRTEMTYSTVGLEFEHNLNGGVASNLDMAGFVLLPDSSTVWLRNTEGLFKTPLTFDGVNNVVYETGGAVEYRDFTSQVRGAIPALPAGGATAPVVAMLAVGAHNAKFAVRTALTPRTRYVF